jgi:hypothetical protein
MARADKRMKSKSNDQRFEQIIAHYGLDFCIVYSTLHGWGSEHAKAKDKAWHYQYEFDPDLV